MIRMSGLQADLGFGLCANLQRFYKQSGIIQLKNGGKSG